MTFLFADYQWQNVYLSNSYRFVMIRRFLVSGAEDIDILLMLLMAGAGIALAYLINFIWNRIRQTKKPDQ
jgi:hypothetical protein